MECSEEKWEGKCLSRENLFDDFFHICCCNFFSLDSDGLEVCSRDSPDPEEPFLSKKKRDYLKRLYEKKKLKEKSISENIKTPYDRKLNRSSWPIKMTRVSKIKTKPQEKRKKKPTQRSLLQNKFSNPTLTSKTTNIRERDRSSSFSYSESSSDAEGLSKLPKKSVLKKKYFVYEPITIQMIMDVLHDLEFLKLGATLDMIVTKLRALKVDINPSLDLLKEEVLKKLDHVVELGLVSRKGMYYKINKSSVLNDLSQTRVINRLGNKNRSKRAKK